MPALGVSLFLIAIGAILAFAVNVAVTGINIAVVGVILMVIGLIGMMLSLLFWTSFAPFRRTELTTRGSLGGTEVDVTRETVEHRRLP